MTFKVDILESEMLNHNVKRFVTTRPENYNYEPGQAAELTLTREGYRGEPRPFTFTSIPEDENLEFIIKLYYDRDGVTDEMSSVEKGEQFELSEPKGALRYEGPGVFIAGGAGITPFVSMFRQLKAEGELDQSVLWFSNQTPQDLFLEQELKETFTEPGALTLLVSEAPADSEYTVGKIDQAFLEQNSNRLQEGFVYVCGPPEMTEEIIGLVQDLGVEEQMIVSEDWS